MASNGSLRPEQYVRLRAGRDGGTFVVPAAPLCEVSATMAGMLRPGANFVEEQALISVPGAAALDPEGPGATNVAATLSTETASRGDASVAGAAGGAARAGGGARCGVIAVDGPAASGKGTLSRALAEAFGFVHLDTGSLYRATALRMLRKGVELEGAAVDGEVLGEAAEEARRITGEDLASPALREERVAQGASIVSADMRREESVAQGASIFSADMRAVGP
ncbi:hypothetical protein T484DRAFT_1811095 [Baffinella frigidus]|nr:hypothetical protein T484DRAFT_1811095 [Cryptophyta sp. CCMP2293]